MIFLDSHLSRKNNLFKGLEELEHAGSQNTRWGMVKKEAARE